MAKKPAKRPKSTEAVARAAPRKGRLRNLTANVDRAGDGQAAPAADVVQGPVSPPAPDFTVVGVGASAGGLEAFSDLLRSLPSKSGLAIVFVQHLAPRQESMLSSLLGETTTMPVTQVTDGVKLEPDHVYVIAPNSHLAVEDGKLRLTPRGDPRRQFMPVDNFFRSLADYAQERAVGVVLSGTASDGAMGLRDIKGAGGITFAQDPKSAKYDGMPHAAIATGTVDMVLPPHAIASELTGLAHHPLLRGARSQGAGSESRVSVMDEDLQRIFFLLRGASGVDFSHYKQPTIRRRLQRRMVLHKISSVEQYLKLLQNNPAEVNALYQDILIHVTRFFRDPESFDALADHVFPQIIKNRGTDQPVRVWVPGCSTGEEAYSIAVSLLEFLGDNANGTPVQIFATDVSESAVEKARAALYPESIAADVSQERLRRFFSKTDGSFRISKPVRDMVVFARQDLTRDPPFSKLDLIVCRNVLIYLGPALQKRLMNVFHYALKPTGFLLLGSSETIGPHSDLFSLADKRHKIYTKKLTGSRPSMSFPASEYAARADSAKRQVNEVRSGSSIQNEANRIVLAKYAPPGVIVNEDLQIIQFRGQTGPYLEPAPGEASLNLLKMVREGLLYDLRTAFNESRKTGATARREALRVKHNGRILDINLEVTPIHSSGTDRHFLVVFEDVSPREPAYSPPGARQKSKGKKRLDKQELESDTSQRMARLQQELAASREYLQSIIQDLEAANEELQSANEEILSSNEELQSTNEELDTAKEELQSTNEELNTVNEELQARNEELSRVNSDLVNLLSSVQIAIVMVASDLRIRRFTPMAEKVLNLIPSDVGRPISDIKPNIDCPDLEKMIAEAVDGMRIIEQQVKDRTGHIFLMRIRPYKNVENKIDGAVVALFDLDSRARATTWGDADAVAEVVREPVLVLDGNFRVISANAAFCDLFHTPAADVVGRPFYSLQDGAWDTLEARALLEQMLVRDGRVQLFEIKRPPGAPGPSRLRLSARRTEKPDGTTDLIVLAVGPVTE